MTGNDEGYYRACRGKDWAGNHARTRPVHFPAAVGGPISDKLRGRICSVNSSSLLLDKHLRLTADLDLTGIIVHPVWDFWNIYKCIQ